MKQVIEFWGCRPLHIRATASVLAISAAMGAPHAQAQTSATTGAASSKLEEIIVTATKKEERLQQVPVAVTAITSDNIVANRIQSSRDISSLAPNVIAQPLVGGGQAISFTIRGLLSVGASAGSNTGVATYLDGVYLGSAAGSIFDLADIERIEVLRGPQGTLFGRNSNGGAVSITTRNPAGEFGVHQELSYGNYSQFRSKTRIDLPQWGPLSASITYVHSERRGDIKNLGAGTQWDYSQASGGVWGVRTSPKYLGDENVEGVFAAVRLQPSDSLDVIYKFDFSENHFTDNGTGLRYVEPTTLGLYQFLVPAAQQTPVSATRPDAVNNAFTTPGLLKVWGHNLTATWTATDSLKVKNIFSYRKNTLTSTSQIDGMGGLIVPAFFTGPTQFVPIGAIVGTVNDSDFHQYTNETQLSFESKELSLIGGFYISREVNDTGSPQADDGLGGAAQGGTQLILNTSQPYMVARSAVLAGQLRTNVTSISKAVFVSGTFHATDKLDITAGVRQTWDRKHGVDNTNTPLGPSFPYNYRSDKATWSTGISYRPTDDLMAYAKVSTGYISGGVVGGMPFNPETATSYEAGIKADMLGRTLRTNIAVFRADYGDLQFPSVLSGVTVLLNAGKARAQGIEFEGTYLPVRGLTLQANIGYTDFEYRQLSATLLATKGIPAGGTLLPALRPDVTGSGSIQYETPQMPWGGTIVLRGDATYKSAMYLNDTAVLPGSLAAIRQSATAVLNGRFSLTDIPLGPTKANLSFWGKNLTDNKGTIFAAYLGFNYPAIYERARTYGVDLTVDF